MKNSNRAQTLSALLALWLSLASALPAAASKSVNPGHNGVNPIKGVPSSIGRLPVTANPDSGIIGKNLTVVGDNAVGAAIVPQLAPTTIGADAPARRITVVSPAASFSDAQPGDKGQGSSGSKLTGKAVEGVAENVVEVNGAIKEGDIPAAAEKAARLFTGSGEAPQVLAGEAGESQEAFELGLPAAIPLRRAAELGRAASIDGYPYDVRTHYQSHRAQVREWFEQGLITQEVLAAGEAFIEPHDGAYILRPMEASRQLEEVRKRRGELLKAWTHIALATGHDEQKAAALAEKTYQFIEKIFTPGLLEKKFGDSGAAARYRNSVGIVLGHGSMSMVETKARLMAAGWDERKAEGFALLAALHHPGFPITMVHGFTRFQNPDAEIAVSEDLVPMLLIRKGTLHSPELIKPEGDEAVGRDAARLRAEGSDYAAGLLGVSRAQARLMALLFYALDRITAARRNYPDFPDLAKSLDFVDSPGRSVGEISKRHGLILTNFGINPEKQLKVTLENPLEKALENARLFTLSSAFDKTYGSVDRETKAAVRAVELALEEMPLTETQRKQFRSLLRVVRAKAAEEPTKLALIQDQALEYAGGIPGFSGLLMDLDRDIQVVREQILAQLKAGKMETSQDDPNYERAGFLLAALLSIRNGAVNKGHVEALLAVGRASREASSR